MRFNGPPASVNIIFYFFKKADLHISGWCWVGGFFISYKWVGGVDPTRSIIVYTKIYDQVYQPLHEFKFVVCYNVY